MLKKFLYIFLISIQIVTLRSYHKVFSIESNNKYKWKLHFYYDTEDLKDQVFQDPDFIRRWAYIAHILGFVWCGGTKSPFVGEDFSFEKSFENNNSGASGQVYYLKANYNNSDENAKKYGADERLQMKINNVRLIIEPNTLRIGTPRIIETKPITIASGILENTSDKDNKTNISFTYASNKSWSKSSYYKLNEKIDIKTKFLLDIPLSKNKESKLNVEFGSDEDWRQSEGIAITEIKNIKYYDKLQAKSKKQIDLIGLVKKIEVPYEVKMYIEYDMTLTGILGKGENRNSNSYPITDRLPKSIIFAGRNGNSHVDHPTDRPKKSITFGGRNDMSATEELLDIYSNRHIKGYSEWDWQWIIDNFGGKERVDRYIEDFCTVKRGGEIKGVFNVYEGNQIEIKRYDSEPIDIIIKDQDFSKENKVEVKDFKSFKTPGFNVQDLTIIII